MPHWTCPHCQFPSDNIAGSTHGSCRTLPATIHTFCDLHTITWFTVAMPLDYHTQFTHSVYPGPSGSAHPFPLCHGSGIGLLDTHPLLPHASIPHTLHTLPGPLDHTWVRLPATTLVPGPHTPGYTHTGLYFACHTHLPHTHYLPFPLNTTRYHTHHTWDLLPTCHACRMPTCPPHLPCLPVPVSPAFCPLPWQAGACPTHTGSHTPQWVQLGSTPAPLHWDTVLLRSRFFTAHTHTWVYMDCYTRFLPGLRLVWDTHCPFLTAYTDYRSTTHYFPDYTQGSSHATHLGFPVADTHIHTGLQDTTSWF